MCISKFYTIHRKILPHLSNRFTTDHNRYFVSIKTLEKKSKVDNPQSICLDR